MDIELLPRRLIFANPERSIVRISHDGTRVAFLAPVDGVLNLWVGPIARIEDARSVTKATDRNLGPWVVWMHDNRHVLFFRDKAGDENWCTWAIDLESGEIRALTPQSGVSSGIQQFSRDFPSELLIKHNERDKRHFDLYRVNVATGESNLIERNEGGFTGYFTDQQLRVLFAFRFTQAGGYELVRRGDGGRWDCFERVDADDQMTTRAVEVSADGRELYWLDSRGRDTAAVIAQDVASGATRMLAEDPRSDFTGILLDPVLDHRARDGLALVCYLSRPRGSSPADRLPMVLLVHGGPWARDLWGLHPDHQWLANRGYAVLSVNFRGSTGFGKSFVNAGDREWAGKMHTDLIDAVDWAVAQGIADPTRVAIMGTSYGGYSALVGVTFTPEKFACAVDLVGVSNLVTFLNTIPDYWQTWKSIWAVRVGDYKTEEGRKFLEERSPLNRADRIVRPLLIGQGANDVRVKAGESEQIVAAMQRHGTPVTYIYYPDEGHGLGRPENRRAFAAVTEAFLAQHLGGRHEPIGGDFDGSTITFRAGRDLILSDAVFSCGR